MAAYKLPGHNEIEPPPPPPPMPIENGHDTRRYKGPNGPSDNLFTIMTMVHTVTHILIGAVVFSVFCYANLRESNSLSQHIYLCVIGYVVMMGEGILAINRHAGWARILSPQYQKIMHMVMQLLGSGLVIVGSIIKIADQGPNASSTHAILGIIAMTFAILTLIAGLCHYCLNMPRISKIIHFVCASLTLIIAFLTLIFGVHNYYRLIFQDTNANLVIALAVGALLGILFSSSVNTFKRA